VAYERLDRRTIVLRLRSFGYEDMAMVQGLISSITPMLQKTENLIIDLRDNSGGSDFAWQGLLPLVYTQPIKGVAASLYSTPDNIARLERQASDPSLDPAVRAWLGREVAAMRAHPGEFVRQPDPVYKADRVLPYPKRVGVLVNRGCASSCEQLVLTLRQSRKVTIFGERTAGAVDYTNLVAAAVPGGEFDLVYPVSRSQRLPEVAMDEKGIQPDVLIPLSASSQVDWVHERLANRTATTRHASGLDAACSGSAILSDGLRPECSRDGVSRIDGTAAGSRDPAGSSRASGCPSPQRSAECERAEAFTSTCHCGR
jgi:C-terminal processing protease CtpA/Prc